MLRVVAACGGSSIRLGRRVGKMPDRKSINWNLLLFFAPSDVAAKIEGSSDPLEQFTYTDYVQVCGNNAIFYFHLNSSHG